jgi:hypothetical protein
MSRSKHAARRRRKRQQPRPDPRLTHAARTLAHDTGLTVPQCRVALRGYWTRQERA